MDRRQQLISMEGWCHKAYPDPKTGGAPITIGVGHTGPEVKLGLVWDDDQILAALEQDEAEAERDARAVCPSYDSLDECRQAVVWNMAFNMGRDRLSHFKGMLSAIASQNWADAANAMRDSLWYHQVPKRVSRLALQLELGTWQ
jgi:lysozyme